ncbi:LLM class flavin-dependent oxidoreductase [Pseudonocardia sichuanensis]|uniref:LLM class flavin-dependent oxidoreductase n=1 Tax=Pseudonocardia kunmingensis TaxID=630975 RepID=UPI001FE4D273|nr:LLM class flavin-dependent oxidoreductase [Pseudonocardia kunmingensis]
MLSPQFTGQSHTDVLDAAAVAGLDDVWVAEHHFMSYGVCPSALTLAGFLLGATRRIVVGTPPSPCSPPSHPIAVAEQTLLLNQVSGGRFRLGMGRGCPWIDQAVFGSAPHGLHADLAEALDVLLAALRGTPVHGHGPAYPFPEVGIVAGPRTLPRPGVVVAATSNATVDLAARRGLPLLLLGMHADDTEKAAMIARHRAISAIDDTRHVGAGIAYVADTDREALATLRARLPDWLGPGLAGYRRADGAPRRTRDPLETRSACARSTRWDRSNAAASGWSRPPSHRHPAHRPDGRGGRRPGPHPREHPPPRRRVLPAMRRSSAVGVAPEAVRVRH